MTDDPAPSFGPDDPAAADPVPEHPDAAPAMPVFWQTSHSGVRPPGRRSLPVAAYGPPAPVSEADSRAAWGRPSSSGRSLGAATATSSASTLRTVWTSTASRPEPVTLAQPPCTSQPDEPPRTSRRAVLVLALGCCSLIPLLGLVAAIAAVCLAPSARRGIVQSEGRSAGSGLVLAGQILGWIFVAVYVLGVALPLLAHMVR